MIDSPANRHPSEAVEPLTTPATADFSDVGANCDQRARIYNPPMRRSSANWPPRAEPKKRTKMRLGAVSYLNSKPLVEGLADFAPDSGIVLDYPSRLADAIDLGHLDVALIPSVECFGRDDYVIVSDACVATHGPVLSVKLYSRLPLGDVCNLALDEGSRTSAALVRVMLAERYGIHPELRPLPMRSSVVDSDADAILLIGDRAMHPPGERFEVTWDLGEEWLRWTGLPFVFAMWAARDSVELDDMAVALSAARDLGCRRLSRIAFREAPGLGIPVTAAQRYLTENLHFRLGSAERNGLRLFHQLAAQNGLVSGGGELVFHDQLAAR